MVSSSQTTDSINIVRLKMKVEELFGTLQQSVIATWRKHLKTKKYSNHMALDEYYKDAPELIDSLIEEWQGTHDKIEKYEDLLKDKTFDTAVDYLTELRKITKEGRELMDSSELESDIDAILSLIDSVIYKLKELKEGHLNLVDFLRASSIDESGTSLGDQTHYAESWMRQAWTDRDMKNTIIAVLNGFSTSLKDKVDHPQSTEKEKKSAQLYLDIIDKMYQLL